METERRQETIQYSMESPKKMQALQQRNYKMQFMSLPKISNNLQEKPM